MRRRYSQPASQAKAVRNQNALVVFSQFGKDRIGGERTDDAALRRIEIDVLFQIILAPLNVASRNF
jgi:hypothetical protein